MPASFVHAILTIIRIAKFFSKFKDASTIRSRKQIQLVSYSHRKNGIQPIESHKYGSSKSLKEKKKVNKNVERYISPTSTGRFSFPNFPVLFKTFNADIAVIIPNDPSKIPASTTVSYLENRTENYQHCCSSNPCQRILFSQRKTTNQNLGQENRVRNKSITK